MWGAINLLLNGAILFGAISFTAGMSTGVHWWHAANGITYIILLIAAIGTPIHFRLFSKVQSDRNDRSLKFLELPISGLSWQCCSLHSVPTTCSEYICP
ncbi:MAG: hypothetical protein PHV53_05290 [Fermentimonas sp.]|nr:hypothetical protein [Fermentimonas sp.]